MRIAITGGSGFIGRALTHRLVAQGNRVRATFFNGMPFMADGYTWDRVDLRESNQAYRFVQGAEVVYHMAGVTGGAGFLRSDPLALATPNLIMAANVFDACRNAGVRKVICMSSTTGYPDSEDALKEDDYFTGNPPDCYFNPGHTRRFIERLAAMYPFEATFLRCAGAYGPGDNYDADASHVIAATVRKVAERHNPLVIWGDGLDERDGVYIDDLVSALVLAKDSQQDAYNIGTGRTLSVNDIAQRLLHQANDYTKIEHDISRPSTIRRRLLDVTKAHDVLGWTARISMEEGLCRTLEWYCREHEKVAA